MGVKPASDSPNFVVDMVCDVCRLEGFRVDKNVQGGSETPLFVDIVASRKSRRKTQRIAFECWEGDNQVNGREVENFVLRLRTLGLSSGIYVSPKGFTGDAEFIARKLGVELWDLAKLKNRLDLIKPAEVSRVPGTLPVARNVSGKILAHHLENGKVLRVAAMPKLEFRPYYFAKFEAQRGRKKIGKGVVVLDGIDGRVCDAGVLEGHLNRLPATGLFLDCLELEPLTGSMPSLPPGLEMKNSVTVAPTVFPRERVETGVKEALHQDSDIDPEDVKVSAVSLLHVPIVTVELAAGERTYRKIVQAATGKIIWDETLKCLLCDHGSRALCEACGGTVCDEHLRRCSSCQKFVCTNCAKTRGVLSKQTLCPNCKKA